MRFRRRRTWSDQDVTPRDQRMPWMGVDSLGRPMMHGDSFHTPSSDVRRDT